MTFNDLPTHLIMHSIETQSIVSVSNHVTMAVADTIQWQFFYDSHSKFNKLCSSSSIAGLVQLMTLTLVCIMMSWMQWYYSKFRAVWSEMGIMNDEFAEHKSFQLMKCLSYKIPGVALQETVCPSVKCYFPFGKNQDFYWAMQI